MAHGCAWFGSQTEYLPANDFCCLSFPNRLIRDKGFKYVTYASFRIHLILFHISFYVHCNCTSNLPLYGMYFPYGPVTKQYGLTSGLFYCWNNSLEPQHCKSKMMVKNYRLSSALTHVKHSSSRMTTRSKRHLNIP